MSSEPGGDQVGGGGRGRIPGHVGHPATRTGKVDVLASREARVPPGLPGGGQGPLQASQLRLPLARLSPACQSCGMSRAWLSG